MKFLVDAQLPARLADFLATRGHDAVHVATLRDGYQTSDSVIAEVADRERRVVVTKDADFRYSHLVARTPARLPLIATGNTSNTELLALIGERLAEIDAALTTSSYVELRHSLLVIHSPEGG